MIALIVAYGTNRVIGNRGKIPWNLPGEQKRFQELTIGNVVVMGRRTYEEIGRPLPERTTLVVSNTARFEGENLQTVGSLQEALDRAGERDVYIAGGARLYAEALPLAQRLYITEVSLAPEGDTFFPPFDETQFERIWEEKHPNFQYVTYQKKERPTLF